ncbi:MAG: hypothetical protein ACLP5H_07535 [Desulfomonilaceae bacterium]
MAKNKMDRKEIRADIKDGNGKLPRDGEGQAFGEGSGKLVQEAGGCGSVENSEFKEQRSYT